MLLGQLCKKIWVHCDNCGITYSVPSAVIGQLRPLDSCTANCPICGYDEQLLVREIEES